jgi:hypothetical protein
MTERSLKICIWSGLVAGLFFVIGLWPLAQFIPLVDPQYSADQVAGIYRSNTIGIRLGGIAIMFSASFNAAFFGAIYTFVRRIEGGNGPYAITQAMSGAILAVFIFLPAMLFTVTAFRPERPVELTLLMNDFAWLALIIPTPPGIVQALAVGFAILGDKSAQPLLPRWAGYMSLWVAVLTMPAPLAVMFKSGPFAWNGFLAFWMPAGIAGIWLMVMLVAMLRAVKRAAAADS